jgi:nucleotide-binding universal stress UspA family protein
VPGGRDAVEAAERHAVWADLEPVIAAAGDVPVHRIDRSGYPADELVEYATEVGAGLIVVGSRGRGDLAALVLGSTSHRVIHAAPCSVLVVKGESQ